MKKIKLFHSYIYLQNSKNIKCIDNKIYDKNNGFLLGLLNIPKENELYKIIIQKNLISNKLSKKKFYIHSYYNKNNAKVYLEVDYDKLYEYVKYKKHIPNKNTLFKLLEQNYLHILENDKNIFDVLCLNKHHRKEITSIETIKYQSVNPYIFDIYQLCFNIKTKEIKEKDQTLVKKKYNNYSYGYLFICDNIHYTINTFLATDLSSSLIVTRNKNIWQNYLKNNKNKSIICNVNELSQYEDKKINTIIYDNIQCCNMNFNINADKKWYISNKVSKITIDDIRSILNTFLNIKVNNIDESILYSLSKIIYYRNFIDYYKKNKSIVVNSNKLQKFSLPKFEPVLLDNTQILNDFCCVCYNKFDINTLCKTTCQPINHYFCQSCIGKILSNTSHAKCPACRQKIDKAQIKKVINDPNILAEETQELSSLIVKLFNKNTDNIIICLTGNKYTKFIKNILNLVNCKSKFINNDKTLYQNVNQNICIVNLNHFDYNLINKISKKKKVDVYSINTNQDLFNTFLINIRRYYENIYCENFI